MYANSSQVKEPGFPLCMVLAWIASIARNKNHLDVAKRVGADNVITYTNNQSEFLSTLKKEGGLLDSAIVFAPSELVVDTAISSVKKGGMIVLGVLVNIPNFDVFAESAFPFEVP